ncbi:MAG: retropepsin-like aspartic protease [bacterium]
MGKIVVKMRIRNLFDEVRAKSGIIKEDGIRELTIDNALVDTGATMLSLPTNLIEKLGLEEAGTREVRTANGTVTRRVFREVLVEIQGRDGAFDVLELPIDVAPLIGQIVLEQLDLYPDLQNQRLTGRPDAPDHMVVECYLYLKENFDKNAKSVI